jgi:quercetin dioxygenase-like cupin family protein
MHRRILVAVVLLALVWGGALPAAGQESTPAAEAGGSGVTIQPLATAALDDLPPAPAFLGLARYTFAPGSATPPGADPGPILIYVESGEFAATIEGPATLTRAADAGGAEASPASAGGEAVLQAGDAVAIPAGTSSSFRNDSDSDASLLAVLVLPEAPFTSAATPIAETTPVAEAITADVTIEILSGGTLQTIPAPPAILFLARQTIAPGGGFPPEESLGPVLAYVEAGRVSYTVESGASAIRRGRREGTPETGQQQWLAMTPGTDTTLGAGDALIEEAGTVSGAQNTDDSPHVHLIVLLGSEEAFAGMGEPAAATPAA